MKDLFIIFAVALVVAVAFETCDVFNDDKSHACPIDACEAEKPKYQGKIDASKIYSDEQEQREMYGHTGAEAYEMMITKHENVDTVFYPGKSVVPDSSLKVKLVAGRWEVESALPVRIKLKDGYLENNGDSIAMGFEYGDIAKDFDALVEEVKAKKRRGESWFIGTPLTPAQYDYLMRMIEKVPDTSYVKAVKNAAPVINPKDGSFFMENDVETDIGADTTKKAKP